MAIAPSSLDNGTAFYKIYEIAKNYLKGKKDAY